MPTRQDNHPTYCTCSSVSPVRRPHCAIALAAASTRQVLGSLKRFFHQVREETLRTQSKYDYSFRVGIVDVAKTIFAIMLLKTERQRVFTYHQITGKTGLLPQFGVGKTGHDLRAKDFLEPRAQYRR